VGLDGVMVLSEGEGEICSVGSARKAFQHVHGYCDYANYSGHFVRINNINLHIKVRAVKTVQPARIISMPLDR
jgi:hypothetical protein